MPDLLEMTRYDDSALTVLRRVETAGEATAPAVFRNLVDLLIQDRASTHGPIRTRMFEGLERLRAKVPDPVVLLLARRLARQPRPPEDLAMWFMGENGPIRAAVLAQVWLSDATWRFLLPRLDPDDRRLLLERTDLPDAVQHLLGAAGTTRLGLPSVEAGVADARTAEAGKAIAGRADAGRADAGVAAFEAEGPSIVDRPTEVALPWEAAGAFTAAPAAAAVADDPSGPAEDAAGPGLAAELLAAAAALAGPSAPQEQRVDPASDGAVAADADGRVAADGTTPARDATPAGGTLAAQIAALFADEPVPAGQTAPTAAGEGTGEPVEHPLAPAVQVNDVGLVIEPVRPRAPERRDVLASPHPADASDVSATGAAASDLTPAGEEHQAQPAGDQPAASPPSILGFLPDPAAEADFDASQQQIRALLHRISEFRSRRMGEPAVRVPLVDPPLNTPANESGAPPRSSPAAPSALLDAIAQRISSDPVTGGAATTPPASDAETRQSELDREPVTRLFGGRAPVKTMFDADPLADDQDGSQNETAGDGASGPALAIMLPDPAPIDDAAVAGMAATAAADGAAGATDASPPDARSETTAGDAAAGAHAADELAADEPASPEPAVAGAGGTDDASREAAAYGDLAWVNAQWHWETDRDGRLLQCTAGVLMPTEGTEGLARGVPWLVDTLADDDAMRAVASALSRRRPFRDVTVAWAPDGGPAQAWLLSGVPVFELRSGRFNGFRGTARRPEPMNANPRVARSASPAATPSAAGAAEDAMRTVAHELRTPLTAIIGFAQMIDVGTWGEVEPRYRNQAQQILSESDRLLRTIDDVVDADRLARGGTHEPSTLVIAGDAAARALQAVQPDAESAQVYLLSRQSAAASPVWCDHDRLVRALERLLRVAVSEAVPGETVLLTVRALPDDGVRFSVTRPGSRHASAADASHDSEPIAFGALLAAQLAQAHGGSFLRDVQGYHLDLSSLPAAVPVRLQQSL